MRRETRVEIDDGVFLRIHLDALQQQVIAPLHRADCRDYPLRGYVHPYKRLDETGPVLLQLRNSADRRIDGSVTVVQRLFLGLQAYPACLQSRDAELQMEELLSGNLLKLMRHIDTLADCGPADVGDVTPAQHIVY